MFSNTKVNSGLGLGWLEPVPEEEDPEIVSLLHSCLWPASLALEGVWHLPGELGKTSSHYVFPWEKAVETVVGTVHWFCLTPSGPVLQP